MALAHFGGSGADPSRFAPVIADDPERDFGASVRDDTWLGGQSLTGKYCLQFVSFSPNMRARLYRERRRRGMSPGKACNRCVTFGDILSAENFHNHRPEKCAWAIAKIAEIAKSDN